MKQRSIRKMLIVFASSMILVNVFVNIVFFSYLQHLNTKLIYEECDRCIFQPNSITVPKGLHAIPLQTARGAVNV